MSSNCGVRLAAENTSQWPPCSSDDVRRTQKWSRHDFRSGRASSKVHTCARLRRASCRDHSTRATRIWRRIRPAITSSCARYLNSLIACALFEKSVEVVRTMQPDSAVAACSALFAAHGRGSKPWCCRLSGMGEAGETPVYWDFQSGHRARQRATWAEDPPCLPAGNSRASVPTTTARRDAENPTTIPSSRRKPAPTARTSRFPATGTAARSTSCSKRAMTDTAVTDQRAIRRAPRTRAASIASATTSRSS